METNLKIGMMNLSSLIPCEIEPDSRLESVQDLIDAIKSNIEKELPPLPKSEFILLGNDKRIGDGHRRRAALMACGVGEFWCAVDEARTSLEILRDKASAARHTSNQGSEMLSKIYHSGLDTLYLPKPQYRAYIRLRSMTGGGEEICAYVVNHGRALSIYKEVERVLRFCGMRGDVEFAKLTCVWLVDFNRQREVRSLIENDLITPRTLKKNVREHKDISKM